MHDLILQFMAHARGMWRYRWRALIVAWLMCMTGWGVVYSLPNVYESSTRVFVDTESVLRPLLRGLATETNVMNQVNVMTRALLSRPHLEEVARETDLDLRANTPREMERLIERLRAAIEIRAARDQLYTISYRDKDPQTAHAVVQTLLSNFVGDTLKTNRYDSESALRFLDEQIKAHEARLVESEETLAAFKKKNVAVMPDTTGDYYARLQSATSNLQDLRARLTLAQRARNELLRQLDSEEPLLRAESITADIDAKIAAAEARLQDLRLEYTERHPDIVGLTETLERLHERREQVLASGRSPTSVDPMNLNPVYQSMKIELNNTEVEIARLRVRIEQQESSVNELQRSVDTIPEVEADLAKLSRDYEVTKSRYEALLERYESARLTEDAEQSNEDVKFRVIDPPTMPIEPAGPNRILFLGIALLFGLAGGGLFAYAMNQVNPVFVGRSDLLTISGANILGAVSVILTPGQKLNARFQLSAFLLGLGLLLSTFLMAVVFRAPAVQLAARIVGVTA